MELLMSLLVTLLTWHISAAADAAQRPRIGRQIEDAVELLYQYPKGTWIENLAVRQNGKILVTLLNEPVVDQFDPSDADPRPLKVHTFSDARSVSGVTEIDNDIFAAAVGEFDLAGSGSEAGSWSLRTLTFAGPSDTARASKVAALPELSFPDGLCDLPSAKRRGDVLVGDVKTGKIWRVDIQDGAHQVVVDNDLTAAVPDPVYGTSGVNGMKVVNDTLYFTNTGQAIFAEIPVDEDGAATGQAKVIAHVLNSTQQFDDFAIRGRHAYLVTGSGNSIEKIGLDGTPQGRIIAGNLNSTEIAQPTACAFGRTVRDEYVLYVVTTGGLAAPVNGNVTVGAQVLAVDTRQWEWLATESEWAS